MKIIDNFLDDNSFLRIKTLMENNSFPWFTICSSGVSHSGTSDGMYFTHNFYSNYSFCSEHSSVLSPLFQKINPKSLIRIKGNLYPGTDKIKFHDWHVDYDFNHNAFIFYINTNNGKTIFSNGEEVNSVENRILFFDPQIKHRSTTCSDQNFRMNINCNYFE